MKTGTVFQRESELLMLPCCVPPAIELIGHNSQSPRTLRIAKFARLSFLLGVVLSLVASVCKAGQTERL